MRRAVKPKLFLLPGTQSCGGAQTQAYPFPGNWVSDLESERPRPYTSYLHDKASLSAILAIPLSVGGAETVEAGVLFLLLFSVFFRKLQKEREAPLLRQADALDGDTIEVDEF